MKNLIKERDIIAKQIKELQKERKRINNAISWANYKEKQKKIKESTI
jgi:hypothetical protein